MVGLVMAKIGVSKAKEHRYQVSCCNRTVNHCCVGAADLDIVGNQVHCNRHHRHGNGVIEHD